jgi:hypothetical protein
MPNVPAVELSTKISAYQAALVVLEKDPAKRALLNQLAPSEYTKNTSPDLSRPSAIMQLKNLHESEATLDFNRIHKTWRKALLSKQIIGVVQHVRSGSSTNGMLARIASDAANSLWSERLVSHLPPSESAPSVVRLFAGSSRMDWLRRIVWCGRLKRAIALPDRSTENRSLNPITQNLPKDWQALAQSTLQQFESTSTSKSSSDSGNGPYSTFPWNSAQSWPIGLGMASPPGLKINWRWKTGSLPRLMNFGKIHQLLWMMSNSILILT